MIRSSGSSGNRLLAFILLIVLLSWQFNTVQIAASFHLDRLRLVDASGCGGSKGAVAEANLATCFVGKLLSTKHTDDNDVGPARQHALLVRGNAPLNGNGKFDSQMILSAVEERIRRLSETISFSFQQHDEAEQVKLIVVSLVSTRANDEAAVLAIEKSGTTAQQDAPSSPQVELVHAPIQGSWFALLPPNRRLGRVLSFLGVDPTGGAWELSSRIHDLVVGPQQESTLSRDPDPATSTGQWVAPTTTIVFFHCMRGIDRTGLLAGTYAMRFLGASLQEVQTANWEVGKRSLQRSEDKSLVWSHMKCEGNEEERSSSTLVDSFGDKAVYEYGTTSNEL